MTKEVEILKDKIINANIELFSKKGLHFTMDDLSKSLGISKKTLYKVYDSKEEMFLDLADYFFMEIKKSEQEILNDNNLDTLTKLKKIMVVLPERYQNKGLNNLYILKDKFPNIYIKVSEYLSKDWDSTIYLLEKGMEEGVIRKVSIPVVKAMVEGAFNEFLGKSTLKENEISYETALDEMIEIIINGIKAR